MPIKADLALEMEAPPWLRQAIARSDSVHDFISRDLFKRISRE